MQILTPHPRWLIATALLFVMIVPPLSATTIADAVRVTLERDPHYPIHLATRAVGEGYRQQAGALLGGDPSLSLLAKSDQLLGTDNGYQEYEAAVSMPLWMPGQRGARQAIGERLDQQAGSELQLRTWEVAGKVLQAAWELRLAKSAQQQAQRQWDSAKTLQRDITRRVQAGELARADRLLAEQETLAREADFEDAVAEVEQAGLTWRSLTGLNELPVDLEQSPVLATTPNPNHPRLIAAMDGVSTAQAMRNDTSKNRRARPVLTVYAKRDRGMRNDPFTNSIGAEVSIPFGSGAHSAPGLAKAEAELTGAQSDLAAVERALSLDQRQSERALQQAERRFKTAARRDTLARSRVKLSRRAFALGETDLYQLLLARQAAADAALELERSKLMIVRATALHNHALGETYGVSPR